LLSACYSRVCSHLADSSPGRRGQSAWSQLAWCSSCSSHVLEHLRFDPFGQLFLARRSLADCSLGRRGLSARHQLLTNQARTVHYSRCTSGGSVAFFRNVRSRVADRPPGARGPSAPASWTVHLGFRRVAKSFSSFVSLSLQDCLGFVPSVGRSFVTLRPWQTRVRILGCEFGT
jgi:hypothetical protein